MSGPDSIITEKIFMPLLMNNASSSAATAEGYVIAFCKTARQANKIAKKPNWKILRNDSVCQALQFKDGTFMAAFFSADTLKSSNKILTVNKPCLIFISNHIIYASDPSHTGGNIIVEYDGKKWEIPLLSDGSSSKGISIGTGNYH
jgi:chondroitin AC lyase